MNFKPNKHEFRISMILMQNNIKSIQSYLNITLMLLKFDFNIEYILIFIDI